MDVFGPISPAAKRAFSRAVIVLALVTVGCTAQSQPASPTAAPAAPTAAAKPTTAPAAAASPAASPAAAPSPAASPSPAAAVSGGTRLTLAADGNEARYRVREQIANRPAPSDAVGTTRGVTGTIVFDRDGGIVAEQSRIVVDLRTLASDSSRRDGYIKNETLETDRFPTAEFIPREAPGLPKPLPTSGDATFQLVGDLTVHGVTRPVTWETNARFGEREISGTATTRVKITDFGMPIPRVASILSIDDDARLELDLRATRSVAAG